MPIVYNPRVYTGQISYDDLLNKPFYEIATPQSGVIEWNGEPTDNFVSFDGEVYYLISPATPYVEDLVNATFTDASGMTIATISESNCYELVSGMVIVQIGGAVVLVVNYTDGFTLADGTQFPLKGIYAQRITGATFPLKLTKAEGNFSTYEIQKIDKKYLPQTCIAISQEELQSVDLSQYEAGTIFVVYSESGTLGG